MTSWRKLREVVLDSTTYVVGIGITVVIMCWIAMHFLARRAPSNDPMKSAHTRHLSDDTQ